MRLPVVRSLKEIARHTAFHLGLSEIIDKRKRRRGLKVEHLRAPTIAERFASIYEEKAWVHREDQKSLSGLGSEVGAATRVMSELNPLTVALGCKTLLDVGCGDWTWMRHVQLSCRYIGIDIVPEVIAANKIFERSDVTFATVDAVEGPLPAADVALCREILFHLSFDDGIKLIDNICKSSRWMIATTDDVWFNSDIRTGDYRALNLRRAPYRLPKPTHVIQDDTVVPGRVFALWNTDHIHLLRR